MMQHNRRIRGFSLIEVLVFISVGSVIFFLAIQLIHLSMRISRAATQQREQDSCLSRLMRDFRRDVRQASDVKVISEVHLMVTSASGSSVAWKVEDQAVLRTGTIATDQPPSNERYELGSIYQAIFEHEPANELFRLKVLRTNDVAEQMSRLERLAECRIAVSDKSIATTQVTPATSTESAK